MLHSTTHEGVVRLEYYDKEESAIKGENKRVIILRNCTGCCETSEYKRTRPHAFQFTSNLGIVCFCLFSLHHLNLLIHYLYAGHHVFSTESQTDLDDWIDSINNAIQEDKRLQRRKSKSKTKMAEEARSLSTLHTERSSGSIGSTGSGSVPHPTTLMGRKFKNIYNIHPSALQMGICTHSYSKCIIFSCNIYM